MNDIDAIREFHAGEHLAQPCSVGIFRCDVQLLLEGIERELTTLGVLPDDERPYDDYIKVDDVLRVIRGYAR